MSEDTKKTTTTARPRPLIERDPEAAARAARRAYKRAWAKANPEKVKAQQARYWKRRAEREAAEAAKAPEQPAQEKAPGRYAKMGLTP